VREWHELHQAQRGIARGGDLAGVAPAQGAVATQHLTDREPGGDVFGGPRQVQIRQAEVISDLVGQDADEKPLDDVHLVGIQRQLLDALVVHLDQTQSAPLGAAQRIACPTLPGSPGSSAKHE